MRKRATWFAAFLAIMTVLPVSAADADTDGTTPQTIAWTPCEEEPAADCGTLTVPIDWSKPDGAKVDIAVARRKATDPAARNCAGTSTSSASTRGGLAAATR
ncbi:hypothetical protein ACQEUU_04225 [Nonomuraea sp. CA-218870]|uniref:hypothetical protein n=1 Tax=Nonomuraea sp. CA-218870 TaxID=3239998 RepID=UPI003D8F2986